MTLFRLLSIYSAQFEHHTQSNAVFEFFYTCVFWRTTPDIAEGQKKCLIITIQ